MYKSQAGSVYLYPRPPLHPAHLSRAKSVPRWSAYLTSCGYPVRSVHLDTMQPTVPRVLYLIWTIIVRLTVKYHRADSGDTLGVFPIRSGQGISVSTECCMKCPHRHQYRSPWLIIVNRNLKTSRGGKSGHSEDLRHSMKVGMLEDHHEHGY